MSNTTFFNMIYKVTVAILAISVASQASPILSKLSNIFKEGSYGPDFGLLGGIKDGIDFVLSSGGSYGPEGFDLIDIDKERLSPRPGAILETDTIFDIDRGYGADDIKGIERDRLGYKSDSAVIVETDDILDTFGGGFHSDGLDKALVEGGSYGSSETLLGDIEGAVGIDLVDTDGGSYAK